jgi:hypothetical protein
VISPRLYRHLVLPILLRLRPAARPFLQATEAYLPYFAMDVTYDNAAAREALEPADITPARLDSYFTRLLDYALLTDWGRTPVSRAQANGAERADPAPGTSSETLSPPGAVRS